MVNAFEEVPLIIETKEDKNDVPVTYSFNYFFYILISLLVYSKVLHSSESYFSEHNMKMGELLLRYQSRMRYSGDHGRNAMLIFNEFCPNEENCKIVPLYHVVNNHYIVSFDFFKIIIWNSLKLITCLFVLSFFEVNISWPFYSSYSFYCVMFNFSGYKCLKLKINSVLIFCFTM